MIIRIYWIYFLGFASLATGIWEHRPLLCQWEWRSWTFKVTVIWIRPSFKFFNLCIYLFEWNIYLLNWFDVFVIRYEMKQPKFHAKLFAMKLEFWQAAGWNKFQRKNGPKPIMMAKDMGMTTNLVECMNFVLKGACVLPIIVLVKTTFKRIKLWFVERGVHVSSIL